MSRVEELCKTFLNRFQWDASTNNQISWIDDFASWYTASIWSAWSRWQRGSTLYCLVVLTPTLHPLCNTTTFGNSLLSKLMRHSLPNRIMNRSLLPFLSLIALEKNEYLSDARCVIWPIRIGRTTRATMIVAIATSCPSWVLGVKSPYPTVEIWEKKEGFTITNLCLKD